MQMISASKSRQKQVELEKAKNYAEIIRNLVKSLKINRGDESWYCRKRAVKKVGVLLLGPSRGLVGGMVGNLTGELKKQRVDCESQGMEMEGVAIQKMGRKALINAGVKVEYDFSNKLEKADSSALVPIMETMMKKFKERDWDEVWMIYPKFTNLLSFGAVTEKILPVFFGEEIEEEEMIDEKYLFEPDKATIMEELVQKYLENQLVFGVLNLNATEQAARMMAMKTATDNANELSDGLNLEYNKQRQNKITQQIVEIASGGQNL